MGTGDLRKPGRYLAPELARGIKEAKQASHMSWRKIGRLAGRSHSFLVNLARGRRIPSQDTVTRLARVLPLDEDTIEGLREVAVGERF